MQYADPFFLGQPEVEPDKFSPKYGIRFNAQGFDRPRKIKEKKVARWKRQGMPDDVIEQLRSWPAKPIGELIDEAIDATRELFSRCGGELARRASAVNPTRISRVVIEPAPFLHPLHTRYAPGLFDPNNNQIHSVALYYQFDEQWLRRAQEILLWEFCNGYAEFLNIAPYPRTTNWPCDAARA